MCPEPHRKWDSWDTEAVWIQNYTLQRHPICLCTPFRAHNIEHSLLKAFQRFPIKGGGSKSQTCITVSVLLSVHSLNLCKLLLLLVPSFQQLQNSVQGCLESFPISPHNSSDMSDPDTWPDNHVGPWLVLQMWSWEVPLLSTHRGPKQLDQVSPRGIRAASRYWRLCSPHG